MGCIGAWAAAHLIEEGQQVIAFDLNRDTRRIGLLLETADLEKIVIEEGDLTDFNCVSGLFERHSVDHVIHLAALQVPFCQADPVQGARVNVVGTVNLFEAARQAGLPHLAYASSVAVYGPVGDDMRGPLPEEVAETPLTMYGVFKQANEGTARMYWTDYGLSSIGLRPHTVYGPGRDRLRSRPGSGDHQRSQQSHACSCRRRTLHHPVLEWFPASVRLRCGATVH